MSLGHLSLILSAHFLDGSMARQASVTAIAKRYWIKTRLDVRMERSGDAAVNGVHETSADGSLSIRCLREAGSLRGTRRVGDTSIHPAGEIHALAPRPRPAVCFDAKDTMGAGSARRNFGFLEISESDTVKDRAPHSLVEHALRASDHFAVQKCISHSPGALAVAFLLITEFI